jgi:hypothetical protein
MKLRHLPSLCAALLALCSTLATAQTSAVPGFISYQGRVVDASGANVGAGTPVNRTVIFRIWDNPSSTNTANLIYSEAQTVTVSEGEFSVLVGQGVANTTQSYGYSETAKKLADIGLAFGGSTRFLGVTVAAASTIATTDNEITPRQQIVSTAFAMRAKYAEQVGSNGIAALTALDSGNIGIGNTNPPARFTVTGANTSTSSSNPQLIVTDSDPTERLRIGVDSTGNGTGFIQAFKEGVGAQNLLLNPNGGNVGIGTATPGFPLSMASTLGDKIALFGTSGAHFGFGIQNNQFQIHTDTNAADVVFGYGTSAAMTETMRIKGNGKVGIGKSAPGSNLDVQGFTSYRGNPYTIASFAANATLAPLNITQGNSGLNPAISAGKNSDGNFDSLSFMTKDIERIKISVEGLVGIGTSTPTNLLQVLAPLSALTTTSAVTSANAVATIGAGDVALHFGNYDGTNAFGTWIQAKRTFDALSFGLALNPNGGNVGIGTASPGHKLDVAGTARVTGQMNVQNHIMMTNNHAIYGTSVAGEIQPAFWPRADNGTYLNYGTSGLFIRNNASALEMYLSGGRLGVGTTDTSQGAITTTTTGFTSTGTANNGNTSYAKMSYRADRGGIAFDVYNSGQFQNVWRGFSYDGNNDIDWYSDRNLKKDIVDAEPMLDRLMQVPFRRYRWKDISDPAIKPEFGVIAQEVEPLFPDLVATGKDGLKTVGYTSFATITAKALQEYKTRNDADLKKLNARIQEKDAEIQALRDETAALRHKLAATAASQEERLLALERRMSGESAAKAVSLKTVSAAE